MGVHHLLRPLTNICHHVFVGEGLVKLKLLQARMGRMGTMAWVHGRMGTQAQDSTFRPKLTIPPDLPDALATFHTSHQLPGLPVSTPHLPCLGKL